MGTYDKVVVEQLISILRLLIFLNLFYWEGEGEWLKMH